MEKKAPIFDQVRKEDLVSVVYESLHEAILTGKLQPGTRISEAELSRQMGISRAPVREAARLLERRGILIAKKNRGFFVKSFDKKEIDEIYSLRIILEVAALKLAVNNITDEGLQDLKAILQKMKHQAEHGDIDEFVKNLINFHLEICKHSKNDRLVLMYQEICDEIRIIISWVGVVYKDPLEVLERLDPLMSALEQRNGAWAASAIEGYVRRAWSETSSFVEEKMGRIESEKKPNTDLK